MLTITHRIKQLTCRVWVILCIAAGMGASVTAELIYVDNTLKSVCYGNYSVANRSATGTDGTAYTCVVQAANVAQAGDTVLIRAGVYCQGQTATLNDVLWPKHSGEPGSPITFKAFPGEIVILGQGTTSYPNDNSLSIARTVVNLTNVNFITIQDLQFRQVAGWVYGRHCQHIIFTNDVFADAYWQAKNVARLIDSQYCSFVNCAFTNGYDNLSLNACDYITVLNCSFSTAQHSLLALRSCNFNVIRNCKFQNPYYEKGRPEKLVEVYDFSLDDRDPANPAYVPVPLYDHTKHNLFESNYFGYFPANQGNVAAQPSAMEYSGQNGIIRNNVFSNPPLARPDPNYPTAKAGGYGIFLAYGGSWTGWDPVGQQWVGQGNEAGFVTHNRFFHNVFYGYDNACINAPDPNSVSPLLNPPPMYQSNPTEQFWEPYQYADNLFVNNIISPGLFQYHVNWHWQKLITGLPVATTVLGPQTDGLLFLNNNFYSHALQTPALIYLNNTNAAGVNVDTIGDHELMEATSPQTFDQNLKVYPAFANPAQNDFRLQPGSPLTSGGAFLTVTAGSAMGGTLMTVGDVGFFYDGFGIEGEVGDLIQLAGQTNTARILQINYEYRTLTLARALTWQDGQGVSLPYAGTAPDIGLGLAVCTNAPALPPQVVTLPVSTTSSNAILAGSATPNLARTTGWFRFGATTNYGLVTPMFKLGAGNAPVVVDYPWPGLAPATTYHFQLVASNSLGVVISPDASFTTPLFRTNLVFSRPVLSHTNLAGTAYTLVGAAISSVTPAYQWWWQGTPIAGATRTSLALSNLTVSMTGNYSQTATTAYGYGSSTGRLTVIPDLPPPSVGISLTSSISGGNLVISWPQVQTGWQLQQQSTSLSAGLGTNWVKVSGSTSTNRLTIPVSSLNTATFFRLVFP